MVAEFISFVLAKSHWQNLPGEESSCIGKPVFKPGPGFYCVQSVSSCFGASICAQKRNNLALRFTYWVKWPYWLQGWGARGWLCDGHVLLGADSEKLEWLALKKKRFGDVRKPGIKKEKVKRREGHGMRVIWHLKRDWVSKLLGREGNGSVTESVNSMYVKFPADGLNYVRINAE